jgi:transposase
MKWIQGWDRNQQHLLPAQVEDYLGPENPIRFLDAFVDELDLPKAGFAFPKENPQERGRPSYHPAILLKLFLYGYLTQIRSSRRLEQECNRNLEVMWLVGGLKPDHKTISDFRKNNAPAFKKVVRQLVRLCREMDLFGAELLAVDGTKIKAQNSPAKNWSQNKLEKQLAKAEERLNQYLRDLEQADAQKHPQPSALKKEELQQKIQQLRQRKEQAQERLETLAQSDQTELSATDPESRGMRSQGRHLVGYNVQGVIDAKNHLLVVTEVTNAASDQGQLAPMAAAAKQELQIQHATILGDGGYFKNQDIKDTQEMGMEPHVPPGLNSPSERAGLYGKADFTFDSARNLYVCPNGAQLSYRRETQDKGKRVFYYANSEACAKCPLKSQCTKSKFRTISRWEHEECIERMLTQMAARPEKLAARKTLIEHPWGTIKWLLPGGFLLRGIKKVGAEVSLAHWAYNFKRLMKILGFEKLIAALRRFGAELGLKGDVCALIGLLLRRTLAQICKEATLFAPN